MIRMLKADFDFFISYHKAPAAEPGSWRYRWLFCRYLVTQPGLFILGLRLGGALARASRLQALYFLFFNIFWSCDIRADASFGPGMFFPHPFGIVVAPRTVIGGYCVMFNDVTFGKKYPGTLDDFPRIGKNVLIGPGARLLGGITLGDDIVVGCNSVVTKSVPTGHTVVAVNQISAGIYPR